MFITLHDGYNNPAILFYLNYVFFDFSMHLNNLQIHPSVNISFYKNSSMKS